MSTLATEALAVTVWSDDENLRVRLGDCRRLSVPLWFYPRLMHASPVQRATFRLIGDGVGIHCPDVDEDLSVEGLLHGIPDQTHLGREHRASCEVCKSAKRKAARPTPRKQRASA